MAKLRSRYLVPPNGYYFMQGDIKLDGGSFQDTVILITKHRASNGLPPGNPEQELNDAICARAPTVCDYGARERHAYSPPSFAKQATTFLGLLDRWREAGFPVDDEVEAHRKGDICLNCPGNQKIKVEEKRGCCGSKRIVEKLLDVPQSLAKVLTWPILRNRSTPADAGLHTCTACGCSNKASQWIPRRFFKYDDNVMAKFRELSAGKCWKL